MSGVESYTQQTSNTYCSLSIISVNGINSKFALVDCSKAWWLPARDSCQTPNVLPPQTTRQPVTSSLSCCHPTHNIIHHVSSEMSLLSLRHFRPAHISTHLESSTPPQLVTVPHPRANPRANHAFPTPPLFRAHNSPHQPRQPSSVSVFFFFFFFLLPRRHAVWQ